MASTFPEMDYHIKMELCSSRIHMLHKERNRITQRGRLTEAEDRRLDEIDMEIRTWQRQLEEMTKGSSSEED